jgi:cytochrome c biogenesis protein CcmG/thiol:disulfide interchange protein DsbE
MGLKRIILFVPLLLLVGFLGAVAWRLSKPEDRRIASHLVGRPVPAFVAPPLVLGHPGVASADFATGKGPRLVNLFASWCAPCIAEAPLLAQLKREGVTIDGIAVRDRPEDVAAFLTRNGDPYAAIGGDFDSRVQLALGASGVPETYVVDGAGVIRLQHIGPVSAADLPELRRALAAAR